MDAILEAIYYRLPAWGQNVLFSLKGLQLYRRRYNKHFHRRLAWLREAEWWPAERIRAHQDEQLRSIVRHAYETVPFYKGWFDAHGVKPGDVRTQEDLPKLPILTREAARAHQDELVSTSFKRSRLLKGTTSGTTGSPMTVCSTKAGTAYQFALWARHKARFGLTPKDRYLMIGGRPPVPVNQDKPPYWRHDVFGRRVYISYYHLGERHMPAVADYLNSHDFDYYTGYASGLYVLADYFLEKGIRLLRRPKAVVTGTDALLPAFEARIRQAFGVPVTEQYGVGEFAGNMSKCELGKFHLDFECCCVEALPLEGAPEGFKRIVFTGWGNPAMPFIRYDVGDFGRPSEGPCRCGRESICFESVNGRTEDYIRTPDGRKVMAMGVVPDYAPGVKEVQVYQPCVEKIQVRIVAGPEYSEKDQEAMRVQLRRRLGDDIEIEFVRVDRIARTATGKFRAVVSDIVGASEGEQALREAVQQ